MLLNCHKCILFDLLQRNTDLFTYHLPLVKSKNQFIPKNIKFYIFTGYNYPKQKTPSILCFKFKCCNIKWLKLLLRAYLFFYGESFEPLQSLTGYLVFKMVLPFRSVPISMLAIINEWTFIQIQLDTHLFILGKKAYIGCHKTHLPIKDPRFHFLSI